MIATNSSSEQSNLSLIDDTRINNPSNVPLIVHDHILISLKTIHDHVMNILELSIIQRDSLNFENPQFAIQLESILSSTMQYSETRLYLDDLYEAKGF